METYHHRELTKQLADDLNWLEDYCRRQPELTAHAAKIRLAAALTRNVVGPAIDGQPCRPLFVAVVGGAGAGKSTVVNYLCGSVVADANPQAGFTRHPTAFLPADSDYSWPSHLGFLGPLRRLNDDRPSNLDEDVYQVRRVPGSGQTSGAPPASELRDFVVWDCPDMTTWASTNYVSRLIEVVGLADVVVYVASDERYNDEVPTQFLHLIIRSGKAVVCCLTKMNESDAEPLINHFRGEVLGKLPSSPGSSVPSLPCVALPKSSAEVRADPSGKGSKYRIALLNQLLALSPNAEATRTRTVRNAVRYLEAASEGLLEVARNDLAVLEAWTDAVEEGRKAFEDRYRREFLSGETFRQFDRTRDDVMNLLDLPGAGKPISAVLAALRMPYQYARDATVRLLNRPAIVGLSEQAVCNAALSAWLDRLEAEARRRAGTHPIWQQITQCFDAGLKAQALDRFHQEFRSFELAETDELDQAARAVPDYLANNPGFLTTARVGIVSLDLAAAAAVVWATVGPNWSWYHLLLIPLAVSATRQGVELVVHQAVDAGKNRIRGHREALLAEKLTGPLATWLTERPTTAGTTVGKLRDVLSRIPTSTRELAGLVATLGHAKHK